MGFSDTFIKNCASPLKYVCSDITYTVG